MGLLRRNSGCYLSMSPRRWCTNVTWITKVASELGKVIIIQVDEIVDCTSPSDFNFQLSTDSLASCFLPHVRLPRWPNKCRCSCWRCPSWWGWGVHSLLTYSVPVKNRCLLPNFKRSKLILWMDKSDKALSKASYGKSLHLQLANLNINCFCFSLVPSPPISNLILWW